MEICQAVLTSLLSIVTLFLLTKLMGNREMSQLSMFDYINGITIGSIAAELATSEFTDSIKPFVAMLVYAGMITLLAVMNEKSLKLRNLFSGKTSILYHNGELYSANLKKAKIDINEFMSQCRINGYFNLSDIHTVILEPNGKFSILARSDKRPVIGTDLGIAPSSETLIAHIIMDGTILKENLRHTGNNETWLLEQLKSKGVKNISDVFLATCDLNNQLQVFKKHPKKMNLNLFE